MFQVICQFMLHCPLRRAKVSRMSKEKTISEHDAGAAMMAWYKQLIRDHPDGLVTQAQAAVMLGISRVAICRLVSRGHLQAFYFPKAPDVEGLPIGRDDPTWLQLMAWLDPVMGKGHRPPLIKAQACYVSFRDVQQLWYRGDLLKRCEVDWLKVFTGIDKGNKSEQ